MSSVVLTSLSGTSTGGATLTTGLIAGEERVVANCFLPAGLFRDTGDLIFEIGGLAGASATTVLTAQIYQDTKPIKTVAGVATGTALLSTAGGTPPNFTWTPGATDAYRFRMVVSINDQATTTSRLSAYADFLLNQSFSDGTADNTTRQNAIIGGTLAPNVGTFGVDTYVGLTFKMTIANPAFTVKSARILAVGVRSQGSIEGEF